MQPRICTIERDPAGFVTLDPHFEFSNYESFGIQDHFLLANIRLVLFRMLSLRELTLPYYDLRNHISVEQEHSSIQFRLLLRRRILLTTVTRDYRKHQLCFLAISSLFFTIVCFICRCCLDKLRKNISLHFILFFNMIFWLLPGSRYGSLIAYRMFKYIPIRRFCDDIRLFLCTF